MEEEKTKKESEPKESPKEARKDITDKDVEEWFKNKFESWGKDWECKESKKRKVYRAGAGWHPDQYPR